MESRQCKKRGCPRKLAFGSATKEAVGVDPEICEDIEHDVEIMDAPQNECLPEEVELSNYRWAIRRMPTHCVRKCFGMLKNKRCTNIMQSRSPGLSAPCFWGERCYKGTTQQQWMWFCSHDVQHTRKVTNQVKDPPESPNSWLIAKGTTLTYAEKSSLEAAGFILESGHAGTKANSDIEEQDVLPTSSSRPKKWRAGVSKEARKRLDNASLMQAQFVEECVIKHNQHVVFKILTHDIYEVHIKKEPICSCADFKRREINGKSYLACKHIYYVYTQVLGLQQNQHMIIHQPVLNERDLHFILSQKRCINSMANN